MTDTPQMYLRRCNGHPETGIKVSRETVESILAVVSVTAVAISGDLDTGVAIRLPAGRAWEVEPAGTVERTFTYVPMPTGQHRAP